MTLPSYSSAAPPVFSVGVSYAETFSNDVELARAMQLANVFAVLSVAMVIAALAYARSLNR